MGEDAVPLGSASHMATVTSATPVMLSSSFSRDALEGFLEQHGDIRDSFRQTLDHRLRWARTRRLRPAHDELAVTLMDVVGDLDPSVVVRLPRARAPVGNAAPGELILMRQGEEGDCPYLVVSGRLRVFGERNDGSVVEIADKVGPGERRSARWPSCRTSSAPPPSMPCATPSSWLSPAPVFERLVDAQPKALAFFTRNHRRAPEPKRAQPGPHRAAGREADGDARRLRGRRPDGIPGPGGNLKITQMYHRRRRASARGAADANWCTFACSASKTAGYSIRGEVVRPLAWLSSTRRRSRWVIRSARRAAGVGRTRHRRGSSRAHPGDRQRQRVCGEPEGLRRAGARLRRDDPDVPSRRAPRSRQARALPGLAGSRADRSRRPRTRWPRRSPHYDLEAMFEQ